MREVADYGCITCDSVILAFCAIIVMAFAFQVQSVSMTLARCQDMKFDDIGLTVSFLYRKINTMRCPLLLRYGRNKTWTQRNPITLIERWRSTHLMLDSTFPINLSETFQRVFGLLCVHPTEHCKRTAHSLQIGDLMNSSTSVLKSNLSCSTSTGNLKRWCVFTVTHALSSPPPIPIGSLITSSCHHLRHHLDSSVLILCKLWFMLRKTMGE